MPIPPQPPAARPLTKAERALDLVLGALVTGPDPPRDDDPPSLTARFLPWWLRVLAVIVALAVGLLWSDTGVGQQLAWGLDYGALIAVSLAASYAFWIFGINLGLALLWSFLPLRPPEDRPRLWKLHHLVTFVNRQVGHIEAFATWLIIAAVAYPRIAFQLPFATAVVLLGPPLINGLARTRLGKPGATKAGGELNWARRPIIYAFTTAGLIVLALQAPRQIRKLVPVIAAVFLGGVVPRYLRHRRRDHLMSQEPQDKLALRQSYRDLQMGWPRRLDVLFTGGLAIAMIAVLVAAWQQRRDYDDAQRAAQVPPGGERADVCARDPGGPTAAEVSIFIASDTQLHELQGERFPGQAELADAFVPVALRPVELDVLAATTLWRFGSVFRDLAAHAPAGKPMLWAHLGDFADLACEGEMSRMDLLFDHFMDGGRLAGVAPGNHDKSFTGNFFWSPFWDQACKRRLEKVDSDGLLEELASARPARPTRLVAGATMKPVPNGLGILSALTRRGSALVTVSPLGEVSHQGRPRGLVGVFLDSADEIDFDLGIAGLYGTFSRAQADTVIDLIHDLQGAKRGAYLDPVYLLFAHHPFAEVTSAAHGRMAELIARLDAGPDPKLSRLPDGEAEEEEARDLPPRVLALVAAHTHHAQSSRHCVRHRRFVREVVVGSTIDPPQEAALLTVGPDESGAASLRLRTLPAVGREDRTCGAEPTVLAGDCQRLVAELQREPDCKALFRTEDRRLGADCQELEKPMTLSDRLHAITSSQGPTTPRGIKQSQVKRTEHLFSCLCRQGACTPPRDVTNLTDDRAQMRFLIGLMQNGTQGRPGPAWEQELTCLAWAAGAVQSHKSAGMQMADALRCAFDDPTAAAAKEYVASLKTEECR